MMLNINYGHNKELMEQCQTLKEYAQYVNYVRRYAKDFELNEAVKLAVNECIHDNILSDFLRVNKAEVISMSIFEYDREWEEELLRKEEFEAGRELGEQLGKELGRKEEQKNTEKERMNAEKERRRADLEKLRADNAEKELMVLREKLTLLQNK